jgi:hypothetical protein
VLGTVAAIKKARKEGQTQDFDALVDKLLGLDEQARHSNEAAAEAEAIAAESALDYVEPSAEDMANGVAFSLSRQTESPAFKKWFGNSKVTDTEGNPLMLVHVTDKAFTKFTPGGKAPRADIKAGKWSGRAIWLKLPFGEGRTEHRGSGRTEGSRTIPLFAKIEQPMIVDDDTRDFVRSLYGSYFPQIMSDEAIQMLRDDNYDGVIEYEKGHKLGAPEKITEVVVFDPTQVKSAFGNRGEFDGSKADITLSVSPSSRLELVQRRVESALKRDPEKRRELAKAASDKLQELQYSWDSQRWTPSGDSVRPLAEKRSVAELNKEQAVREAVRADDLISEQMAKLSPSTLAALSKGTEKLEDRPLIHAMLGDHGKLVSKSTALRRYNEAQGYDGAPWIPPKWYAGPGQQGLTPDQMAQGLHESGLLRDPSPDALWEALDKEIKSVRSANEAFRAASEKAVEIEKQARAEAKKQAEAWRKDQDAMQSKDYSPKARLLRDLRTLDALLSVLPAEIRGKVGGFVKLATLGSDKARLEEISARG